MPKTQLIYLNAIRDYRRAFPAFAGRARGGDVRAWVGGLTKEAGIGPQRIRQHMAALKFFYTKTLWRPDAVSFLS